eukprot:CAMPEP_0183476862 /NCGR_PEP_ID=MMETSP0370-20130417/167147_1 /TAXON_ID=268820 /ORGANISM="Peridinium aciculiferum, Strain PAER-2" /LENGTH=133 /DNA_ID=CAMNT_0025669737 /DNA_START=688 /DNA_END=1086 /DNA_ORIENTATION=-
MQPLLRVLPALLNPLKIALPTMKVVQMSATPPTAEILLDHSSAMFEEVGIQSLIAINSPHPRPHTRQPSPDDPLDEHRAILRRMPGLADSRRPVEALDANHRRMFSGEIVASMLGHCEVLLGHLVHPTLQAEE